MKHLLQTMIMGFALTAFHGANVSAQVSKGTIFLGTSVGTTTYSSATDDYDYIDGNTKNTDVHAYTAGITPTMGIFVTNRLIIGGTLGFNYSHNKTTSSTTETSPASSVSTTNTTTVNLGPLLRYYFYDQKPSRTMLYLQVQGTAGTGSGSSSGSGSGTTSEYTSGGTIDNIFTWTSGASIGVTHFITKDIGMDFAVGYAYSFEKTTNANLTLTTPDNGNETSKTNNYDLSTHTGGITLNMGFHWFIPSAHRHYAG